MRRPHNFIHGLTDTPEHCTWMRMIARCEDINNVRFSRYGQRGIRVCEGWRNSFMTFLADIGKRPTKAHSLDRIDNDGNYSPANCRWATASQQLRNYSRNRLIHAFGERKTVIEWSEDSRCGITLSALYARLGRKGWTNEEVITRSKYGIRHEHGRKPRTIKATLSQTSA